MIAYPQNFSLQEGCFALAGIFSMLLNLKSLKFYDLIASKPPLQKWRCRRAAGGVLRQQTFFQCFKLCLKLSYHKRFNRSTQAGAGVSIFFKLTALLKCSKICVSSSKVITILFIKCLPKYIDKRIQLIYSIDI